MKRRSQGMLIKMEVSKSSKPLISILKLISEENGIK
jgi:hypothetical protein